MKRRRDALVGASRIVDAVNRIGLANQPGACATVGHMEVRPNSRNTIPGQVFFTIDFRHPDDAILLKMRKELEAAAEKACREIGLQLDLQEIWHQPALKFDPACVAAVKAGTEAAGLPHMDIVSGAGHDACHVATIAPTAMIFVPCKDGISHNEVEDATAEHVGAGCNVLLHAIIDRANAS
jgi:N-carbamoyl-L-amino-acid hydrolase